MRTVGIGFLRMKLSFVMTADVPHMMGYATQPAQTAIDRTVENAPPFVESAPKSDTSGYTARCTSLREEDVVIRLHPTLTSVESSSMCLLLTNTLFHLLRL